MVNLRAADDRKYFLLRALIHLERVPFLAGRYTALFVLHTLKSCILPPDWHPTLISAIIN